MKMLKALLSVLALVAIALAPALRAQVAPVTPVTDASPHNGHHGEHLKKLAEKLGLTEAQIAQIKPILQDEKQSVKALKADTTMDKKAKRGKLREIRRSHMEQILAILTPEQQVKFKEMMHEHRMHRRGAV